MPRKFIAATLIIIMAVTLTACDREDDWRDKDYDLSCRSLGGRMVGMRFLRTILTAIP